MDEPVTNYFKYILKFVRYCGNLHQCLFYAENIITYPDLFLELF